MNARTCPDPIQKTHAQLPHAHLSFETEEALAKLKLTVLEFTDGFGIGEILRQPIGPFSSNPPSQEAL